MSELQDILMNRAARVEDECCDDMDPSLRADDFGFDDAKAKPHLDRVDEEL